MKTHILIKTLILTFGCTQAFAHGWQELPMSRTDYLVKKIVRASLPITHSKSLAI